VALLFNPENTSATGYWKSIDAVAPGWGEGLAAAQIQQR
jgi:hypothetical protein